jgi:hypothetical protein
MNEGIKIDRIGDELHISTRKSGQYGATYVAHSSAVGVRINETDGLVFYLNRLVDGAWTEQVIYTQSLEVINTHSEPDYYFPAPLETDYAQFAYPQQILVSGEPYWQIDPLRVARALCGQSTTSNLLLVERRYLTQGRVGITHEVVRAGGTVIADCFSLRFVNQGTTTVMVGDYALENNEVYDVPGTPGYDINTGFRVVFDDGTTGTAITKKSSGQQAVSGNVVSNE